MKRQKRVEREDGNVCVQRERETVGGGRLERDGESATEFEMPLQGITGRVGRVGLPLVFGHFLLFFDPAN